MTAHRGGRITSFSRVVARRRQRVAFGAPLGALLAQLIGACSDERVTQPASWSCENTRPALTGTWAGPLDGAYLVLQIVEGECMADLTFPYVGWPLAGTWTWKGIGGQLSGGGPLAGTISGPYSPSKCLTYGVTLGRGFDGNVSLTFTNLPASTTVTAELRGVWDIPPTPTPGPVVLQRR